MKTLIVPVDFSVVSNHVADYALAFAETIGSSLTLVHVYQLPLSLGEVPVPPQVIIGMMDDAEKNLHLLNESLLQKSSHKIKIYAKLIEGKVITQLDSILDRIIHKSQSKQMVVHAHLPIISYINKLL
ncbi:MAG: universal stress protein [Sediminibacterium sp.]